MISVRTPANEWTAIEEDRVYTSWFGRLMMRWWGRLLMAAIGWTGLALMFSLPNLMTGGFDKEFKMYCAQFWAWGMVTPLIIAFDRRLPFSGRQLGMRVLAHLAA
ncbi:MAG TPA: hypothetical protein VL135_05795, partial [Terracidiphilus sp.]|nr:hypothetical protein [Terracidiphilus sp.]